MIDFTSMISMKLLLRAATLSFLANILGTFAVHYLFASSRRYQESILRLL